VYSVKDFIECLDKEMLEKIDGVRADRF